MLTLKVVNWLLRVSCRPVRQVLQKYLAFEEGVFTNLLQCDACDYSGSVSGTFAVFDIVMTVDGELPMKDQVTLSRDGIIMLPAEYTDISARTGAKYKYDGKS